MRPQRFAECNKLLTRPPTMTPDQCFDIHAYANGQHVVTAWRPTPEELVKINLGEPVWLIIWGRTMPPVCVTADRPFTEALPAAEGTKQP